MTLEKLKPIVAGIETLGNELEALTIEYSFMNKGVNIHLMDHVFADLVPGDALIEVDSERNNDYSYVSAKLGEKNQVFCLLPKYIKTPDDARIYLNAFTKGYEEGRYARCNERP